MTTSHEHVGREDRTTLVTTAAGVDLVEMLFQLARVKVSLSAELDRSLRVDHDISLQAFDVMTAISERRGGCDEPGLASALALPRDEVRALIDSLTLSGDARRTVRADGAELPVVMLTLRGTLVLNRAARTLDRELSRRIGSVVSADDLAVVEDALGLLRQRPVATVTPLSSRADQGSRANPALDASRTLSGSK